MSDSLQLHGVQPAGLLCPWDSPGKNTGMGCHALLQGIFPTQGIKSGSPSLQADSLPSELPGKPKNTGVGSLSLLQGIFLTQESNWGLLHCRQILHQLSHQGSPCLSYDTSQSHVVSKPVFSIYLDFKVHFLKVSKIGAPNGHIWKKIMVVLNYNSKYKMSIHESDAKKLGSLCTKARRKYRDRVLEEQEKWL